MKKVVILLMICALLFEASGQTTLPFKDPSKVEIVEVVYYVNPLLFSFGPCSEKFQTNWFKSKYATSYVGAFDDFPNEALKYYHKSNPMSKEELAQFEETILNADSSDYPLPYVYVFGEIHFKIDIDGSNKEFIVTFDHKNPTPLKKGFNRDFDLKDYPKLESGVGIFSFLKEDGLWKVPDQSMVYEIMDTDKVIRGGFSSMLDQLPTYQLSFIKNGEREFRTICNEEK